MSTQEYPTLQLESLGILPYQDAWRIQCQEHEARKTSGDFGKILFLEHTPVLTLGKNASDTNFLISLETLEQQGVDIVRSDRGGEVTAHMPGQLVIYPILALQRLRLSPKQYVEKLLEVVQRLLLFYGIESHIEQEFPGVWVGTQKICAVGVRIKERVSMHGLALNIDNDLSLFQKIVPCGIQGRGVCSLKSILRDQKIPTRMKVEKLFTQHFSEVFRVQIAAKLCKFAVTL